MEKLKRYIIFFIGLYINSLGVALITKASLGTSPISSIPYVLSLNFPFTLGNFTIFFSLLLIFLQLLILRKNFKLEHVLQIPISILFGYFIDWSMILLGFVNPSFYLMKIIYLLIGCLILGFGVSTETLEENAMVQYKDRQTMAVLKGVEDNFEELTEIDSILYGAGEFLLHDSIVNYGIMGVELVATLGTGLEFVDPLQVYLPKRNAKVNMANPGASFKRDYLYSPGVVFVVNQQQYDGKYILTSLDFIRQLLDYTTEVSAIELKLKSGANVSSVQSKIEKMLGDDFVVQDRYQQQADVFRIMEIEKLISYLFLTFILMIACFNVIGSLSMLILDKKDDVVTLRSLGANDKLISRIFLFEGRLISLFGAISGIILGLILCFIQQKFGVISLGGGGGTFIVDAYPVSVHAWDVVLVFITVLTVGFLSVWYPVRYLSKRLL